MKNHKVIKLLKIGFLIFIILFSIYLLYVLIGIYLNGMVNLTYEVYSLEDLKYVVSYSKILIIYVILVIAILIYNLISYFRKNR